VKLKLTVDGKQYEVEVEVDEPEQPRPNYVPAAAGQARPASIVPGAPPVKPSAPESVADESHVCRSPISGVVVRVTAQQGQTIQANDALLVLEAMKMETVITAPIGGKVAQVNASVGDSVQAGQVLVEFE
jgi:methylmalonyl-CoA carboxyltransferase small subunit